MGGIVIDIDGVVADSEPHLVNHIEASSGKKLTFDNPRKFQFNIDIPLEDLMRYINEAIVKYKHVIPPLSYATTYVALIRLEKQDGIVNFLSARSGGAVEAATRFWLDKSFPNINYALYNIGDMTSKYEWMKINGFDAIVEDRFKTANECDFENGLTFLVNQPWNLCRREADHVNRVKNLYQAVDKYIKWVK